MEMTTYLAEGDFFSDVRQFINNSSSCAASVENNAGIWLEFTEQVVTLKRSR